MILDGKVLRVFPETKTEKGITKRKFVLGFSVERNYAIIVSTIGEECRHIQNLEEGQRVQVVGSLHTAMWKESQGVRRSFEIRANRVHFK